MSIKNQKIFHYKVLGKVVHSVAVKHLTCTKIYYYYYQRYSEASVDV